WGKPHEAAGIHHPARRRGSGLAAGGAGATAGEATDHRVLGLGYAYGPWPLGRRFFAAAAHTHVIEYRWAEGSSDRAAVFAAEFVRLKVDIIVTYAVPMVLAAKQATSTIPIVFAAAADPVGTGLVASLARPGGNVTGLSAQHTELAGKRLALLREIVPSLR